MTVKQASKLKLEDFIMLMTNYSWEKLVGLRCLTTDAYQYYVEGAKSRIKTAKNHKEKKKILKEEYGTISGFINFLYREEIYAKEHRDLIVECKIKNLNEGGQKNG